MPRLGSGDAIAARFAEQCADNQRWQLSRILCSSGMDIRASRTPAESRQSGSGFWWWSDPSGWCRWPIAEQGKYVNAANRAVWATMQETDAT